jgi:Uma2 family endonuclease
MNMQLPFTEPHRLKLRIEDFELLDRAGAFDEYGKVELIDGVIEVMNGEFRRHTYAKNELTFRLRLALEALGSERKAFCEASLALPSHNLSQPDVIVALGGVDERYYELRDVAIVIEVADSSAARDLGAKFTMYAAQGVPEYWVVALPTGELHQFWAPSDDGFAERRVVPLAGELRSATMLELAIDGRGIL